MSVNLVSEENLYAALHPYRVVPETFEAAVRERLDAAQRQRHARPLDGLSPRLRSAAAFLPLEILTGTKAAGIAAQVVPATGASKLLAYLTFPAVSLFVLLGATLFSFVKIRDIQREQGAAPVDKPAMGLAIGQWWRRHLWGAALVYAATFGLSLIGATWLMFLLYIISFGLLVYVLSSLARLGLGNRVVIGQSCLWGLIMLGQLATHPWTGEQEIHFVDPGLVSVVFDVGYALLMAIFFGTSIAAIAVGRYPTGIPRLRAGLSAMAVALFAGLGIVLMGWLAAMKMGPILRPATPARIKSYVESFDQAPYGSASWRPWEIVARWAIDSKLAPDLSGARRLLAREIAGEQDPFVLGSAFRLGLVRADEIGRLKDYEHQRKDLPDAHRHLREPHEIYYLEQKDWVIRAAVLRQDLSEEERDALQKQLHANLKALPDGPYEVLPTALRVTRLLKAIGRPVDPAQYRQRVHDWLRRFHSKRAGGFEFAGGFRTYPNQEWGNLEATADAIELMETYGIPDGLDLNWVRSFLRPDSRRDSPEQWIAAVCRDRLNHLPGVTGPTWLEVLYAERSLIAATVLVGLCLYATLSSPLPGVPAKGKTLDEWP
jgi:hypothetical protein